VPIIVPVSAASASEALRRREVDLVVAPRDPASGFGGAALYPVWLAAVGAGLVAGDLEVGLLAGRPVATFPEDTVVGRALAAAMQSTGARLEVVHEHRSAASLLALAEHGVATAVLISEALPPEVERRAARLCVGGVSLGQVLWLQWRDEATLPTAARQLRDVMLEEAERARRTPGSGRG